MIRTRAILAIVLIAFGLLWIGQGTGLLQGSSFMVGDPKWAGIGALAIAAGLALGWLELRRRRA
ncbi:MAG TPA: hypothetical protein VK194_01780 [Candidatus Deferrimicrobium sp.]|nr:hypothetical protein [Candidatus Deferrimicrobium sp.]